MNGEGRDSEAADLGFVKRWLRVVFIGVVAICLGILLSRVWSNVALLSEAEFLSRAYRDWQTDEDAFLAGLEEKNVRGRLGYPVPRSGQEWEGRVSEPIAMSWTNSVLGKGRLVLTVDQDYLWLDSEDGIQSLRIPPQDNVPLKWYLRNPRVGRIRPANH